MTDIIIAIIATIGSIFILIAAIGVLKMPDFYTRLSVTVKASTIGVGFLLATTAIYHNDFQITSKVIAIIFFLFITAPIAGHMISRTAYLSGIKMWKNTFVDDLKGKYDTENKVLKSYRTQDGEDIAEKNKEDDKKQLHGK